jgi:hypothetical protein
MSVVCVKSKQAHDSVVQVALKTVGDFIITMFSITQEMLM